MSKLLRVKVSVRDGSDEVMFIDVFDDETCHVHWLPFWPAVWHILKLIFQGKDVKVDE